MEVKYVAGTKAEHGGGKKIIFFFPIIFLMSLDSERSNECISITKIGIFFLYVFVYTISTMKSK